MSESFPRTESGEPDYEQAIAELTFDEATPSSPVYISDGTETLGVTEVDEKSGLVRLEHSGGGTATADIEQLWNDWVHGGLVYKQKQFLNIEESVYNTETHAPVARTVIADALSIARDELGDLESRAPEGGPWTEDVRNTIAQLQMALDTGVEQ
jgi:hypothetical protein